MVARDTTSRRGRIDLERLSVGLWQRWREALARAAAASRIFLERAAPVSRASAAARTVAQAVRDPREFAVTASRGRATGIAAAGIAAMALGAALRIAIALVTHEPLGVPGVAIVSQACWVAGRWVVLTVFARLAPRTPGARVTTAWGVGLLPYAGAATGLLAVVAFALSAWLTFRGLDGPEPERRRAALSCALAFGGEAIGGITAWVVANGLVVLSGLA